jgi:hypothetical protein
MNDRYSAITVSIDGRFATVTLARPEKRNSLSVDTFANSPMRSEVSDRSNHRSRRSTASSSPPRVRSSRPATTSPTWPEPTSTTRGMFSKCAPR